MRQFQDKKILKSKLYSKWVVVALTILLLILAKAVFNIYFKERESRRVMNLTRDRLYILQERKERISEQSESLKTSVGVEEEIRSKFNVAKPGEEVIVVVNQDKVEENLKKPSFLENLFKKAASFFK